jgi:hypothetical protein
LKEICQILDDEVKITPKYKQDAKKDEAPKKDDRDGPIEENDSRTPHPDQLHNSKEDSCWPVGTRVGEYTLRRNISFAVSNQANNK